MENLKQKTISNELIRAAHQAIHSQEESITYRDKEYNVTKDSSGLRKIDVDDYEITFIEQDKTSATVYGERASDGHKITWGMRKGPWILIEDDEILSQ